MVASIWLRMQGVGGGYLLILRERRGEAGAISERGRESKEERLGRGEGCAAAVRRRTWWKEPEGSAGLPCHLTKPQKNRRYLLLPLELEFCLSGMQPHAGTGLKGVRGEPAQPWVAHSYASDMISQ